MDRLPKTEVVSSLPLQMALYFNAYFAPLWMAAHLCTLYIKFDDLHVTYQVTLVALHIVSFLIEGVRLYLGIVGNLKEKIPHLCAFWISTLILQLPAVCYLSFHRSLLLLPLDSAVDIIQIMFLVVQTVVGFMAVRTLAKHQVGRFQQIVINKDL